MSKVETMWTSSCLADDVGGHGFFSTLAILNQCYFPLVEIGVHVAFFIVLLAQILRDHLRSREKQSQRELGVMHRKVQWICVGMFVVCVVELADDLWKSNLSLIRSQTLAWLTISISLQREEVQGRAIFKNILYAWWDAIFILSAWTVGAEGVLGASLVKRLLDCVPLISSLVIVILCFVNHVYRSGSPPYTAEVDSGKTPLLAGVKNGGDDAIQPPGGWGYSRAGLLSLVTFSWLSPLLAAGNKKPLILSDIPQLDPGDSAVRNFELFQECWKRTSATGHPPSLSWTLLKVFWKPYLASQLLTVMMTLAMYVGPVLQNLLITFMEEEHRIVNTGISLVLALLTGKIVEVISVHHYGFRSRKLGLRMWAAVGQAVYEKSLRLSLRARQARSVGEITNIFSADAQRLLQIPYFLQPGVVLPFQLLLAGIILVQVVGLLPMVMGFITLLIIMVANVLIARRMRDFRKGQVQAKDKRMQATAECLGNMKVIKLQAWDEMFKSRIEALREVERKWVQKFFNSSATMSVIVWSGPWTVSAVTFLTVVLLGNPLTTAQVFTALSVFRIIQNPIRFFPDTVSNCVQAAVSCQRIGAFLMEEEVDEDAVGRAPSDSSSAVEIKNASFAWDKTEAALAIQDLTLNIRKGTCVAICGAVGSGKSSLLYSIMGELPRLSGKAQISGQLAYVSQTPWIQNNTIKENILFGRAMDLTRYKDAVRSCGLEPDLAQFPDGDRTEIGERGINLSGGQKQRVQLARAVYQDADVYLLDDPFSAVDAHTGTFLFDKCVKGALKDKTVILVTHQVEFLPATDVILVMKAPGQIVQQGTYSELVHEGKHFGSLVEALQNSLNSVGEATHVKSAGNSDTVLETIPSDSKLTSQGSLTRRGSSHETAKSSTPGISDGKLIQDEMRATGRVDSRVFKKYVTRLSGGRFSLAILIVQLLYTMCQMAGDTWLGAETSSKIGEMLVIEVYISFLAVFAVLVFLSRRLLAYVGVATAQAFFSDMLSSIIRAPMSFIDSTPSGRILSRSSTDQSALDMDLPLAFFYSCAQGLSVVGVIVITVYVTPLILILVIPLGCFYIYLQIYYLNSSRELSRLTALTEAPVFLHLSESIAGATTIRAFEQQRRFSSTNAERLEFYQRAYFHNLAAPEWLGVRLGNLANAVITAAATLLIFLPEGSIDAGMAGLSLSYGLSLSGSLMRLVVSSSQTEVAMVSVERVSQYCNVPSEAPAVIPDSRPPSGWPGAGRIELQNLEIRYRPDTPLVMKGITCVLKAREKVGVVGCTGSGKSTLIQALFRLIEPTSGRILIDGIDITTIGLNDLRSVLGVIPQEPILFEGTVRSNLDPFNLCSDEQIWDSLDKCQLGREIRDKPEKLHSLVSEQGENWSVGQRQLLCLGRALLRHPRILILDEATASVDITTDAVIQSTIRQYFAECTVISVAHRIPTVIDSDRVLVLDAGFLKENNSPEQLLANENSMFSKLVQEYTQRTNEFQ